MFILGLRDIPSASVALRLFLVWLATTIVVSHTGTSVSFLLIILSLSATMYGATRILKNRDTLRFTNSFAEGMAFPHDGRARRAVFLLNLTTLVFCFLPSAAILSLKPPSISDQDAEWMFSAIHVFGYLGVFGLIFQFLQWRDATRGIYPTDGEDHD
jgi:hypothetical protein